MDNASILSHTDQSLRANPSARRIGLSYALIVAGISLVIQLVSFVTTRQMDSTGGLGGIGTRSILAFIQSIVTLAGTFVLPFLEYGHYAVALNTSRGEASQSATLLTGLRRVFPLLRLLLLRFGLGMLLMMAASNIGGILYAMLPQSQQTLAAIEPILADPNALTDPDTPTRLMGILWPMYAIIGVVFLGLMIPALYRLRLSDFAVTAGSNRAFAAMLTSWRAMGGRCLQLLRLDLRFCGFYLLNGVAAVLAYGDVLFGVPGDLGFWLFFLLSLGLQAAVTALFVPRVHTAYATFYLSHYPSESKPEQ